MGKLAYLWNPRGEQKLRRHWVAFEDRIVIRGEHREQSGVLSVMPAHRDELCARLRIMDREYVEAVHAGNDIVIWINGLTLYIGVKAVDDERMLLAFGIRPGSKVNVILESGAGSAGETDTIAGAKRCNGGFGVGLCQTSP